MRREELKKGDIAELHSGSLLYVVDLSLHDMAGLSSKKDATPDRCMYILYDQIRRIVVPDPRTEPATDPEKEQFKADNARFRELITETIDLNNRRNTDGMFPALQRKWDAHFENLKEALK